MLHATRVGKWVDLMGTPAWTTSMDVEYMCLMVIMCQIFYFVKPWIGFEITAWLTRDTAEDAQKAALDAMLRIPSDQEAEKRILTYCYG